MDCFVWVVCFKVKQTTQTLLSVCLSLSIRDIRLTHGVYSYEGVSQLYVGKPDEWHTIYYEAQNCLYGKREL